MELIRKKEDELFKRWREHIKCNDQTFFVQDGALNPELYQGSSLKICSVLKEVPFDHTASRGYNFPDGFKKKIQNHGVDFYRKGKGTLKVLANRISLIRRVIEGENNFDPISALQESAYINIKKYRGTKISSVSDLEKVAKNDKDFLIEHFDSILKPDILLCGKTRHYLGYLYGGSNFDLLLEDPQKKVKLFHQIENGKPKRLVIEMYHPSHRGSESELLEMLESLLKSYMKSENCIFKEISHKL